MGVWVGPSRTDCRVSDTHPTLSGTTSELDPMGNEGPWDRTPLCRVGALSRRRYSPIPTPGSRPTLVPTTFTTWVRVLHVTDFTVL